MASFFNKLYGLISKINKNNIKIKEDVEKKSQDSFVVEENDSAISQLSEDSILEIKKKNSQYLKIAFEKILDILNKKISKNALYDSVTQMEIIDTSFIQKAAKNAGILTEIRKINISDVKVGPAILLMNMAKSVVYIDENKLYNPEIQIEEDFNPSLLVEEYTGYAMFFYEEDLNITSFLKKNNFLFSGVKNFKHYFIEILILCFFINIFGIVYPFYSMNVYDRIVPNYAIDSLIVLSVGVMLLYLFDFVFKIVRSYIIDYISFNVGKEVDELLLYKLTKSKSPGANLPDGVKQNLFKELAVVREFYFVRFIPALIDMPFLILFILVLLLISPLVAIVPIIASVVVFVVSILLQVPLQQSNSSLIKEEQNRSSFLSEHVNSIEMLKLFNATGYKLGIWRRILDKTYRSNFNYNLWVSVSGNFSAFVMNIVFVIVMIVGVVEIIDGNMTTGALIAASNLASKIMAPVIGFANLIVRYRSVNFTLFNLQKIINLPMEDEMKTGLSQKGPLKGEIEFKDVTFFYPSMKSNILYKCSFAIKKNEKIGIIGKTGAGKSTIMRLILGMDFPNSGNVLFDKIDSNYINVNEIRANIGYLPQKSNFFAGTLRDNILMGKKVDEADYINACEKSGVKLITENAMMGDDMLIAEQGRNISGGQQQIIGLARALIGDPPIIVMDEPTNGMDSKLEAFFMENVKKIVANKTFILITHKASQLVLVDRVILLDKGKIVIDDSKNKVSELLKNK